MNLRGPLASILAVTCAFTAAGCGDDGDSTSGSAPKTLSIISITTPSGPGYEVLKTAIATFEQRSGAKVTLTTANGESVISQFESSSLAGNEADLVQINPVGNVRNWLKGGAVVPVDGYLDEWGLRSTINPEAIRQWTIDGQVQGFPYESFMWPLWFNTELLTKAGVAAPPTTIAELTAAVSKLKAAGITGWTIGGSDWTGVDLLQRFMLLHVPETDYQTVFGEGKYCSSPAAMAGIGDVVALRDAGAFPKNAQGLTSNDMNSAFYTGKAAMMLAGSWAFGDAPKDLSSKVAFGGIPLPANSVKTKPAYAVGYTSAGFLVSKNGAKKADLVKQLLQVMYDQQTVSGFIKASGFLPAVANLPALPEGTNPLLQSVTKTIPDTDRLPQLDQYVPANVSGSYAKGSSVAFTPGKTAADVCKALEAVYASAK